MKDTKELFVATVDGVDYLIDRDAEIKKKDKLLQGNQIFTCVGFNFDEQNTKLTWLRVKEDSMLHLIKNCKKIIAAPHKVEGLLQYKLPDVEVSEKGFDENLWEIYRKPLNRNMSHLERETFIAGFKANKAKWTDEDIKDAYIAGREDYNLDYYPEKHAEEYLQSLNKPKEVESVEVAMESYFTDEAERNEGVRDGENIKKEIRCKLKEGLLDIIKVNYNS